METKLKVKAESPPERCEVCHQSDCFDPINNYCSRCAGVSTVEPSRFSNSSAYIDAVNRARNLERVALGVSFCVWINILFLREREINLINVLILIALLIAVRVLLEGRKILR